MLNKFNLTALNNYSQAFAKSICDKFYRENRVANGLDLLSITPIQQVNLFIISELYEKWKTDSESFKSPFFDFESETVKKAMQVFMNVVSQNIAVKRNDLEPIVAAATKNALVLLLDPQGYYQELFRALPNFTLTTTTLEQIKKYTKWNVFIPNDIKNRFGERSFVYINQALEWAEESFQNNLAEPTDDWVKQFSAIEPLDLTGILKTLPSSPVVVPAPSATSENSFFDSLETKEPTEIATPEVEPVVAPVSKIETEKVVMPESLNDRLRTDYTSIADNYQKSPLGNIDQYVPLHQKFMFIHQLFAGSNSAYEVAIAELEAAPNYETARNLIQFKFASQHLWDMTSESVEHLLEIVKRRFGA